jgi:Family of unknown function (DUF6801)
VTSTPGSRRPRPLGVRGRVTIASALVLAAGLIAAVASITAASGAGGSHQVRADLGYSCRFPSATYQVSAVVAASFPASAASGTPIQPASLQVTITLPRQAVAYLRGLGAASLTATGSLAVTEEVGSTPLQAAWPLRTSAAAAVPASGSLTLNTTGIAQPAEASATGTVTFSAAGLDFVLTPAAAASTAASPGTAAASCLSTSNASARLASVAVTAAAGSASASASSSAQPQAKSPVTKAVAKPRFPKGCGDIKVHGDGEAVCGYIEGYSDVKKLYGATLLGPVLVNIDFAYRHLIAHRKLTAWSSGRIYNQADEGSSVFPPVRATFLGFGFVPVTATLSLREVGPIRIVSVSGITAPPYPIAVTAKTRVAISVSDVTVNGVPLKVGPGCRAAYSPKLTLTGHGTNTFPPRGYTVPTGGPLSGTLTIPPFVHCGVTENLDPLLTGSISGAGNFAKMTQGKLCGPLTLRDWTCPPPKPKPLK